MELFATAQTNGARLWRACQVVGLSRRTVQRWRSQKVCRDRRKGPKTKPKNALSEPERTRILKKVNTPELRGLTPHQIVPRLADRGVYLASESTIYRLLHEQKQVAHREPSRPRTRRSKPSQKAMGPNQLWSWDITYLGTTVKGRFIFLYLVLDVWSRKIVGWSVHWEQNASHASDLMEQSTVGLDAEGLVLHSDNGGPMKGATMLATLQKLGVLASFSRPHVSDDNAYSESLFRTLKYRPGYPTKPFDKLEEAQAWLGGFVDWYNDEHLHSAIRFLTPSQRHAQQGPAILAKRRAVYDAARELNPGRWAGRIRNWEPVGAVHLNRQSEDAKPTEPSLRTRQPPPWQTSASRRLCASGSGPALR